MWIAIGWMLSLCRKEKDRAWINTQNSAQSWHIVSQTICVMYTCPKTKLIQLENDYCYYSIVGSGLMDEYRFLKHFAKMFIYALLIAHGLQ